jgi:hypothetical protein
MRSRDAAKAPWITCRVVPSASGLIAAIPRRLALYMPIAWTVAEVTCQPADPHCLASCALTLQLR